MSEFMQKGADLIVDFADRQPGFTGPGSQGDHEIIAKNFRLPGSASHLFTRVMGEDAIVVIGCTREIEVCGLDIKEIPSTFAVGKIEKPLVGKRLILFEVESNASKSAPKIITVSF